MTIASSVHTQSGGISATVMALTALGGFAAGALVAGLVALAPHSASGSNASARISAELGCPALCGWTAAGFHRVAATARCPGNRRLELRSCNAAAARRSGAQAPGPVERS